MKNRKSLYLVCSLSILLGVVTFYGCGDTTTSPANTDLSSYNLRRFLFSAKSGTNFFFDFFYYDLSSGSSVLSSRDSNLIIIGPLESNSGAIASKQYYATEKDYSKAMLANDSKMWYSNDSGATVSQYFLQTPLAVGTTFSSDPSDPTNLNSRIVAVGTPLVVHGTTYNTVCAVYTSGDGTTKIVRDSMWFAPDVGPVREATWASRYGSGTWTTNLTVIELRSISK